MTQKKINNQYDYVAQLPDEIVEYKQLGKNDKEIIVDKGFVAVIKNRSYFIHCTATLPIDAYESDLGFGLWVEVSRKDFFRYLESQSDDKEYEGFECEGYLANDWPLFPYTRGNKVKIKVVDVNRKIHIIDIQSSDVELQKYKEIKSLDKHQKNILRTRIHKFYLQNKN